MLNTSDRLAILLHNGLTGPKGKTGLGLLRYREGEIVAVIDQQHPGASLRELTGIARSVPIVASVAEALAYEPQVLAIGIAPSGGLLPTAWYEEVKTAVAAGLSVVNGLHHHLASDPGIESVWHRDRHPQQWIWDMRREPEGLSVGTARAKALACRRVLIVGTDMNVGKMSASLELDRAARARGWRSRFLATGQTGMAIAGNGVPLDAVRVDYASGAVEQLVLRYGTAHDVLFVEGQGSLLNPASTATLPLMRGAQPTHLILVHRAGQTHIEVCPEIEIPPLPAVVQLYEQVAAAAGAYAPVKVAGIALNTFSLDSRAAKEAIAQVRVETGLPCTDAVRFGGEELLSAIAP